MENKQTAVEWLVWQIKNNLPNSIEEFELIVEQAKQMEKEQIIQAYDAGLFDGTMDDVNDRMYKQYYNETYNNGK